MAHRGDQDLGVEVVVAVDLQHLFDQRHAVLADVVQAADEGRDVGRAGLGGEKGLGSREAEGDVAADVRGGQGGDGAQARRAEGYLDDDVGGQLGQAVGFAEHAFVVGGEHLARYRPALSDQLGDLLDGGQIGLALLGDQAGVGGDAVDHAPFEAGGDFLDVRGVEEEEHGILSGLGSVGSVGSTPF